MTAIQRYVKTPIMHRAVEHGGVVYLGGVVADDLQKPLGEQTAEVCRKIEKLLTEVGSDKDHILSATIFIVDMKRKDEMNQAWLSWLGAANLPTRATIGVADLGAGVQVEIVVTAARTSR